MRGRFIALVIALAVLAFAEIGADDRALTAGGHSHAVSGQFADLPTPTPDVPAIMRAPASAPATIQTVLGARSRDLQSPTHSVFIAGRHLPVAEHGPGKPQFFPLLI